LQESFLLLQQVLHNFSSHSSSEKKQCQGDHLQEVNQFYRETRDYSSTRGSVRTFRAPSFFARSDVTFSFSFLLLNARGAKNARESPRSNFVSLFASFPVR
jgi:hypothetical protein